MWFAFWHAGEGFGSFNRNLTQGVMADGPVGLGDRMYEYKSSKGSIPSFLYSE
jgi:hypothetical protein